MAAWLRGLGLEQYEPAFRANDVDAQVLLRLTAEDLISIGVTSVGHRRRLLDAILALGAERPAASPPDAPVRAGAERRQLTVVFSDLVGSTPLSTRLWRIAWTKICCVGAFSTTILAGSFLVTCSPVETWRMPASLRYLDHIWKKC
jgi:hypothetical protein